MNPALQAIKARRDANEPKTRIIMHSDDHQTIVRSQDCTPIAEYAKRQNNAGFYGTSEMKHATRIPNVIIEKYCIENGVSFADCLADPIHSKRIVENPDNAAFRIWKGRL